MFRIVCPLMLIHTEYWSAVAEKYKHLLMTKAISA